MKSHQKKVKFSGKLHKIIIPDLSLSIGFIFEYRVFSTTAKTDKCCQFSKRV